MTADMAHALVGEIDASWNFSFRADRSKVAAWVKTVVGFEHGDAAKALETCRATMADRPSPALFGQMARAAERQRLDLNAARQIHAAAMRSLSLSAFDADIETDRARDHIAGRGSPAERLASVAYSRVWFAHIRPQMAKIGTWPKEPTT